MENGYSRGTSAQGHNKINTVGHGSHTHIYKNSRVSDQNGISLLHIILEIHHYGREPSNVRD